ncbi:tRNA threonylcarbamoyladenosine biosynthesis protein TsaE [Chryseomicrobium aureum]|uniref:tRNA (adenosine(37)-N6)-threonylcarbamoyltransferase complex ATPase subunit type 1 TsaE n=1 Tax=Chryseomicrobium aureum TaxID=1441723 RepID=UPI001EF95405|nr:tRNA (adenosine(37)-N6)-threonylcarbamoyltransferase complex ATPase subunit type 1 TsaE [Chryseomicrobium aureum]MBM7707119.1 tRNA threonylcarbamoyladenosine biosynthesis protein TsaE [Chryseomicrobium aureum]
MQQFNFTTLQQTERHAQVLADRMSGGEVITLEGDLGAGKTTWTKYFAKALGVEGTVNSPTFTIIKEYEGRVPFYHMDVYRLADSEEDLGWEDYFRQDAVAVVEWAQYIEYALPDERIDMTIRFASTGERVCEMTGTTPRMNQLIKEMAHDLAGN